MYADHELPVALGNRFYGLGKLPRAVVWNGPNIAVSDTDGVRFSCGGGLRGEWSRRPEASKALLDLARIFEGPVVGRRGPGDFVKVFFDWSFEGAEVSEFVGEGILHLEETDELVPFRVHEGRGFAVRGMGFRTCPPERVTARDVKHGPGPR
jgi:hypothetical protein